MVLIIEPSSFSNVSEKKVNIVSKALHKGKRHFGVAGASLTWLTSPKKKDLMPEGWKPQVIEEAKLAEQRTSTTIRDWMKDKPAAVLIDSVHIRGIGEENVVDEETGMVEGGDTDHVLIIGGAIFIIDTKNWRKKATYTVGGDGKVLRNNKPFPGGKVRLDNAVHRWFD